jgi:ABC-type multidrug transport system ATPase subunit
VLRSAGLWVTAGRISVVLGRNGSGKTTIIRVTVGRVRANYGIVMFDGARLRRPRLPWLATRGLFYLPDRPLLCRGHTVREHFDALRHRFPQAPCDAAVSLLRLEQLLDRRRHMLSGGENRRAALALALARRPRCLLADEPFTGLMPNDAALLAAAFRRLAAEGCGLVLTGHEVRQLLEVGDEVFWMTAGTTHLLGTPSEARQHHQFQREYLHWRA